VRVIVQRVNQANVKVNEKIVGEVNKVVGLRIFEDEDNKMNLSVEDIGGEILVVSQFTLYGDVRRGKRPSFTASAAPDMGENFYEEFVDKCRKFDINVETGIFGADMKVDLINDGPVTIMIDSKKTF
jgi:D-aminoacyl-tRNA deacylase